VANLSDNEFESGTLELLEYIEEFKSNYFSWLAFINQEWDKRLALWKKDRNKIHSELIETMRKTLLFDKNGRLDNRTQKGRAAIRRFIKDGGLLDTHLTKAIHSAHFHFGIYAKRNPEGLIVRAGLKPDDESYLLGNYAKVMKPDGK